MTNGKISVAEHDNCVIFRLQGDIRCRQGLCLEPFLQQLFARPRVPNFLIDLTATLSVDSTALGILAQTAIHSLEQGMPRPVILVTEGECQKAIEAVCFDKIFAIRVLDLESTELVQAGRQTELTSQVLPADEALAAQKVFTAHRTLMTLSPQNFQSFQCVTELLATPTSDTGEEAKASNEGEWNKLEAAY